MPRARRTAVITHVELQSSTTVSAAAALAVGTLAISLAGGMMAVAAILNAVPPKTVRVATVNTNTNVGRCGVNADNDHYYACAPGCPTNACDCNDNDENQHPSAPEICDSIDNNCDGEIDEGCVTFRRGDANADGQGTMADVSTIISWLSFGSPQPRCMDAADGNDDGRVDLSDAKFIADWYSAGGRIPPRPGPYTKGSDPTTDQLDCQYYP